MLFDKSEKYDSTTDTMEHKKQVDNIMNMLSDVISARGKIHDDSKLESPEKEIFDEYTPKLAKSTYGSPEYKEFLKEMKPGLDHHYANNRHHPEYHEDGIKDMDLVDIIEMICDWKAATMRHNDGDIFKSIELNKKRFGFGDEIERLLVNTVINYFEK